MRVAVSLAVVACFYGLQGAWAEDAPAGDPAAGATKARICKTCHQFGEGAQNSIGPVLNGVVGRKAGTYPGYDYSEANKNSGLTWDVATLTDYLKNPQAKIPGTKMTFAGLRDKDAANVAAYLATLGPDGKTKQP
jgi:cytochrome c